MDQSRSRFVTPGNILIAITVTLIVSVNAVWLASEQTTPSAQPGRLSEVTFPVSTCDGAYTATHSLVYLPSDYETDGPSRRWPVVLFLHGSWHRGTDLDLVRQSGLPRLIEDGKQYPFILIAPQCPPEERWHAEDLTLLLDRVEQQYRVDPDQIHVTGFQLGGYATWNLAAATPDRFASVVPFGGHRNKVECRGPAPEWMTQVHLWHFYALSDEVTNSQEAVRSINTVWNSGTCVRMTDVSEGSRNLALDWTRIYQRNEVVEWMLSKQRKMRHTIRWTSGPPGPGQLVEGELCESDNGRPGTPLVRFWLHTPETSETQESERPYPLLIYLHDEADAGDDITDLPASPLLQALQNGTASPCLVLAPQRLSDEYRDFALLEDLRDQLDVTLAIDPHRQFLAGTGQGAAAAWDFAVRDPFNFSAMALIDFQPDGPWQQEAHRLINLPKHFYSIDRSIGPVVDYCQLVSDMTYKKAAPNWTTSDDPDTESLLTRLCSSGEMLAWFAEQPGNEKRAAPRYRPLGVPYHLKMASPEVVELFERHTYQFQDHHPETPPFDYSLHQPAIIEPNTTYPLVIWMHGHGDSERNLQFGELQWMDAVIPDPSDTASHNFFMMALQCPADRSWSDRPSDAPGMQNSNEPITAVMEIMEQLTTQYPIDPRRISVVGISSGSTACWELLKRHPRCFSAVAPIAGEGIRNDGFAEDLSGERIRAFKGLMDGDVDSMRRTVRHVRLLGADAELTEVLRDAHFVWPEAFFDHQLLAWLLEQHRD